MTNILILGGTGKTGRRIARHLRAAGHPVRAVARTGGDMPFDLGDPTTWSAVLDGATSAYLVEPALQFTDEGRARIPKFIEAAVGAGVRRLVLLSAPAADQADHPLHAAERATRDSGLEWTILRPNWFAQNFSESFWLSGILNGALHIPTGDGRTPFVDADDIAEVAAQALIDDRHSGNTYELTGPRAISFGEAVDMIGATIGRTIRHVDIDPVTFVEQQIGFGVSPEAARLLTDILTRLPHGGPGTTPTDDVHRALHRPARTFENYVAESAASGCWRRTTTS
ncbi:NAD(P)H-binding protein [Nocardia sp. NPDC004168]|uniref:NmrA family NAD(P)-binding protein n=1 Tax=Nocardia sp. NPDC004168 TaxID=3154452 RepID=UPI0033AE2352